MTLIQLKGVGKIIHKHTILDNIEITLTSGNTYGLQGVNGSGKTMLMRIIIGLIHPTQGEVLINGKKLGKELEFPESIGFLLESPTFLDRYSGYENLKMLADINGRISDNKIKDTISAVGLNPDDRKKYKKYSLGMKQRLGIAAAIMEEPDIVILDEPTNALDDSGIVLVKSIVNELKERGALVLVSCHDLSVLLEMSDEIIKLSEGQIVEHIRLQKEYRDGGLENETIEAADSDLCIDCSCGDGMEDLHCKSEN